LKSIKRLKRFINIDFDLISNLKKEEISKIIQEFISKLVFDFSKIWNIVILYNIRILQRKIQNMGN
jgi:hypothetical protein